MNTGTWIKGACIIAVLTASASVSALDLGSAFGKKKTESKKAEKDTLATLEPKLAEKEAQIAALKETYAKKDPEAGNLMTKAKEYGTQASELNTQYGNVAGKLNTYLSGEYPTYKKASNSCSALKKKYEALKGEPKKEEKKATGWGSALSNAAKSTLKDTSADTLAEMKAEIKTKESELAVMQEDLGKKTPEGKSLLAECAEYKEKVAAVSQKQESTDVELTSLLKKRYPDFKSATDDYDALKKTYDSLKPAEEEK